MTLLISLALLVAQAGKEQSAELAVKEAPRAMVSINSQDLEEHAKKLASDEFGGRLTGTEGQIKTAEYFMKHFKKLGFRPMGDKKGGVRTFYQSYQVQLYKLNAKKTGLFKAGGRRLNEAGAYFFKDKAGKSTRRGPLVFVGRGHRDDLQGVKLAGRIPVATMTPEHWPGGNVMQAMQYGRVLLAQILGIAKTVSQGRGKCVVVLIKEFNPGLLSLANSSALYPGKPIVSLGWSSSKKRRRQPGARSPTIPVLLLGGEDAASVLEHLGLSLELAFDEENDLTVGKKSKASFRLVLKTEVEKAKALNVIAALPGTSPKLKKQAIVFSCHMDHLGKAADGKAFYGADDNASGCTSVLEIAEAFAKLAPAERPKRSILFVAVSGEELGLWGSAHYVSNPTWPLKQIAGNINMDMLGRNTGQIPEDTIRVTPSYRHNAYSSLAREAAWLGRAFGMKMANGDKFYQRSDHANFAKKGIPIVFFSDDEHPDYHMTTDTPDKLDYEKLQTLGRLAFLIGYRAGNRSARPEKLGSRKGWLEGD